MKLSYVHQFQKGLKFGDFVRMLQVDKDEIETLKRQKLVEAEKAQYAVDIETFFFYFWDMTNCFMHAN